MEWKPINEEGYEHYFVNEYGEVRNHKKLMKSRVCRSRGYKKIGLRHIRNGKQKTFLVHRLVAKVFCDNPDPDIKIYVNHIDGEKTNNNADNLEWVTQSENQIHAYETGLQELTNEQLERLKGHAIKKRKAIRVVNNRLGIDETYNSIAEASKHVDCDEKTLRNVLKGRHKSRLGYVVSYVDIGGGVACLKTK